MSKKSKLSTRAVVAESQARALEAKNRELEVKLAVAAAAPPPPPPPPPPAAPPPPAPKTYRQVHRELRRARPVQRRSVHPRAPARARRPGPRGDAMSDVPVVTRVLSHDPDGAERVDVLVDGERSVEMDDGPDAPASGVRVASPSTSEAP